MENDITFRFEQEGKFLVLDGTEFDIINYEGLEASSYNLVTEEYVRRAGERLKRSQILSRQIMVEFDYLKDEYADMRRRLIGFFTPLSSGKLTVTYLGERRCIDYRVSSFKVNSIRPEEWLSCLLYIKCLDPFFQSITRTGVSIMTLVGGWKWPFTLPFKLRQYGELKKNILNPGDVEAPVEIYFQGPAARPKIINHRSGEYIQISRDLTASETLYINTGESVPEIEIRTEESTEDGWAYVDPASVFWRLKPGDNMIEYSAGALRSKGVEVFYRARYLGI